MYARLGGRRAAAAVAVAGVGLAHGTRNDGECVGMSCIVQFERMRTMACSPDYN